MNNNKNIEKIKNYITKVDHFLNVEKNIKNILLRQLIIGGIFGFILSLVISFISLIIINVLIIIFAGISYGFYCTLTEKPSS